jgi:hypothetical protein
VGHLFINYFRSKSTIAFKYLKVTINTVEQKVARGEYTDFCSICGYAITNSETSANIEGTVVDYEKRDRGFINMTLCHECWAVVFNNHNAGLEGAVVKRIKLENEKKLIDGAPNGAN